MRTNTFLKGNSVRHVPVMLDLYIESIPFSKINMNTNPKSRRDFIIKIASISGVVAGGSILSACGLPDPKLCSKALTIQLK